MADFLADLKKNKKQAMALIAVLSLLMLILYFNFLLRPQITRVFGAIIKAGKIGADLKNAESDIAGMPKFKNDLKGYEEKVDSYENMLPAEQEIPSLLENLSEMAKKSGIKITSIMPKPLKEDKAPKDQIYKEIPIIINARSGYHELGRFLSDLEGSGRFMKIADIEIKANYATPKKHDVEVLVLTYVLLKD